MEQNDTTVQLRAIDRWGSRRARAIEFLRKNGLRGLIARVHEAGVVETTKFITRQFRFQLCSFLGTQWDRRYGVDTSGQIDLLNIDVLGSNKDSGFASVSSSPKAFAFLAELFPADWNRFTFVDVGCGKGRVLLLAALHGFKKIVGIEFAPALCQLAKRNLNDFAGPHPLEWSVINADATTVDLPAGVPLLIYCFNPFKVNVWEKFIPIVLKARVSGMQPVCLVISGTVPDELRAVAAVIENTLRFRKRAHGVTPFFSDAYAPYDYWVFDVI